MSNYVRFYGNTGIPQIHVIILFLSVSIWQVLDAMSVIQYLRSIHGDIPVHVLGISTGAIVASLLLGIDTTLAPNGSTTGNELPQLVAEILLGSWLND